VVRRLTLFLIALGIAWVAIAAPTAAQDPDAPVVVIDVHDPMDQRLLDYVVGIMRETDAHVFILQVDAPGISSGDPTELFRTIREVPVPVVVWVGAEPATAFGGAGSLLNVADVGAAAPGVEIGYLDPTVIRDSAASPTRLDHGDDAEAVAEATELLNDAAITIVDPMPGYVDVVVPTIGQLIVGLDGVEVDKADEVFVLSTARVDSTDAGEVVVAGREVLFVKPGLWDRFLRLAARPETTFFFLIVGIAAATFEFYAAGVGVTAAVAAIAIFLAGYGLATLPVRWWSVGAVLVGLFMYTWDFQRNRLGWRSVAGTAFLVGGGLTFTDAAPQFAPSWWLVVVIVIGTALFYGIALTTIARSRFSTRTIGRDHLVGRVGVAETDFDPEGIVAIDDARWRGRSHRAAGINAGDAIRVTEVNGIVLDVEPAAEEANQGVRD
jgi:membrane-bound serine protease (ClpP class)